MWRSVAAAVTVLVCAGTFVGCVGNLGRPSDLVSERLLREVEPADLGALSVAPPTTVPTTGPASVPTTQRAGPPPSEVELSIDEARRLALANNLALRIALLDPTIDREQITQEDAAFESVFTADASYAKTDTPTSSELSGSQDNRFGADLGVRIPLRTGGTVNLQLPVSRNETDNRFATLNPAYTSDFAASISQPLLRGAGLAPNARRLRIAHYQYQASQARTKLEVIRILTDIERLYWRLYAARRSLEVTVQEHALAVEQVERAQRRLRVGAGSEVDVADAEAEVARIVTNIITESNTVRENQRELKRLINAPDMAMAEDTIVITATDPTPLSYRFDRDQVINLALARRMEMIEQELLIAQEDVNLAMARNDLLPLVNLTYTYNVNGLGPHIYDALDVLREKNFEDHALGLQVEVPIGNEAAKSRLRQSLARRLQQLLTKESRTQTIVKEVIDAMEDLESNWQQILSTQRQVLTAARALRLQINRFQVGANTSRDVLEAQTRLARARQAEIDAVTTYQINQIDLAFATGTTLGASRVTWAPTAAPRR